MAFKEFSPKLQLSFDEYVETWRSLVMEYYMRGLEPSIADKELKLSEEGMIRYSMDLAAVVLIIAIRICKFRLRVSEDIRKRTSDAITKKFFMDLHSRATAELLGECLSFYSSKYDIFKELCSNLSNPDAKKRQPELIGLARYLVAQVSALPEHENVRAIEQLGSLFIDASATCVRLAENSAVDNQMFGKLKFIVQK